MTSARHLLGPALQAIRHPDRHAVLDDDARDLGIEPESQALVPVERRDEGVGGATALPVPVHELVEADATLCGAIEVGAERLAHGLDGLHEPSRQRVDVAGIGHEHRTVDAVPLVAKPVVVFHAAEMREHRGPAPVRAIVVAAQESIPFVVVGRPPADVDLRVDRRSAAEHVRLRDVMRPTVEMRLRLSRVIAHVLAAVDHLEDARRHVEEGMAVRMTGFEQQDLVALAD